MPARVSASWVDGTVHLWGWDGVHTALPNGLRLAFDRAAWRVDPFHIGHLSSLEVTLPDGARTSWAECTTSPLPVAAMVTAADSRKRM